MSISLTPEITLKLKEYNDHCINALAFWEKNDYEHCTQDFRKSCEALFKILIYDHFGSNNALKIIIGEIDDQLLPSKNVELGYSGLWNAAKNSLKYDHTLTSAYKDIKEHGDKASHNLNPNKKKIEKIDAELCKTSSFKITKWLYETLLSSSIPTNLFEAHNGNIFEIIKKPTQSEIWHNLYSSVDEFSSFNKYILIAPPEFTGCSEKEIESLSRINWSFIIDFNPNSKSNGLYKVFEKKHGNELIPITISQNDQKNLVGEGKYKVNWLFANGLASILGSTAKDVRSWRQKKYHTFIKSLLSDFFSRTVQRYTIIYLYDKIDFIEEIVRPISEINEDTNDLLNHVFVYQNHDLLPRIEEFEKYGIQFETFSISLNEILSGISSTHSSLNEEKNISIIVPARTVKDDNAWIDISSYYPTLLDNNIEVIHKQIDYVIQDKEEDIPAFYKGQKITWKDISNDVDVRRNKTNIISERIRNLLLTSKSSVKFELKHFPGAGGTTIGRRIAFELRNEFPTLLISKYNRAITNKLISDLADKVQKSILAIVEASQINNNELDDLIRKCNSDKKNVVFLYLSRTYSRTKDSDKSSILFASMLSIEERDRFISKFRIFATNKDSVDSFNSKKPSECELIDFSLSLDLEEFNENHILEYIRGYITKLPESEVEFAKYVAIIYHYSQQSVSELIFRSLFKKSLSEDLVQTSVENQFIRKILLQETDSNIENTEYWRPRFSKFAELILKIIIGENWKDHISMHVIELIKKCKENNPYLNDEVKKILKGVLLERNNEDLLGVDEQWKSNTSNEQFSALLRDIEEKQKQKEVLKSLVENYSEESHFLGHYGRFLYEKAEEISDYDEAEEYISKAFDNGGQNDSNLQHIAGMCQRRRIEYYKRQFEIKTFDKNELLLELIELTNSANLYFNASRDIDPYNIHAYVAHIQTLIQVIDFGKEISGISKKEEFITNSEYSYFAEQFSYVIQLIDDAKIVVEHLEANGKSNYIAKANNYLKQSEANTYEILGDYSSSISTFKNLADTADRNLRPYFRSMYIYSILLKKVKGKKSDINRAWGQLNSEEIQNIENALDSNILQDSGNIQSLRLWLRFVRYSSKTISLTEILAKIKIWFENSSENYIANLECAYYLYVIYASLAIRAGDTFSDFNVKEALKFIQICKEKSNNSKFPYEWYGKGEGIKMLINHRDNSSNDFSGLQEVRGTITNIYSKQQGKIKLECGIDAFFVPVHGDYIQGKDETTDVVFYIGFRHDGLIAWNVKRVNPIAEVKEVEIISDIIVRKEFDEIKKADDIEEIKEISNPKNDIDIFRTDVPKIKEPKVLDKIDLSKFDRFKKKR